MDGIAGLEGWRWIFILEGILTVVVAIMAFFLIQDYPETAKFLTEEERAWVIHRLRYQYSDTAVKTEKFQWKYVKDALLDWQIYLSLISMALQFPHVPLFIFSYLTSTIAWYGIVCPLYGISFFLPTIIKDLGYTSSTAQLLTVGFTIMEIICRLQENANVILLDSHIYCCCNNSRSIGMAFRSTRTALTLAFLPCAVHSCWLYHRHSCFGKRSSGCCIFRDICGRIW